MKKKITLEDLAVRLERLENLVEKKMGRLTLRDYVTARKFIRGIKGGPKWTGLANEIHAIGRKYGILVDYELRKLSAEGLPTQCECQCDCCCQEVV